MMPLQESALFTCLLIGTRNLHLLGKHSCPESGFRDPLDTGTPLITLIGSSRSKAQILPAGSPVCVQSLASRSEEPKMGGWQRHLLRHWWGWCQSEQKIQDQADQQSCSLEGSFLSSSIIMLFKLHHSRLHTGKKKKKRVSNRYAPFLS